MPQFELENVGPARISGFRRGRTPEDAVARAAHTPIDAVETEAEIGYHGWLRVTLHGEPAGRIRPHSRQQFRRDV